MKLAKLKNKKKFIIGVVIGIVVVNIIGIAGAIAASVASDTVLYDSPTGKKNVKDAIDELYTMASTHCPDGYVCQKVGLPFGSTYVAPTATDTHLGILYMNPTSLNTSCNASNSVSTTGTKTGCMKWYIYKEDSNYYYLILDHNTTGAVNFSTDQSHVTADTSSWVSSLNPRSITANEVWEITKSTNGASGVTSGLYFEGSQLSGQGTSKYAWLYDYTTGCTSYGCNINESTVNRMGYWTSDLHPNNSQVAYAVSYLGQLTTGGISGTPVGVRPVISIAKS